MDWETYDESDGSNPPIPMEKWGKDHWSTLAYMETREVDDRGILDGDRMRCNVYIHLLLQGKVHILRRIRTTDEYPTILKDGVLQHNHDDWSCMEDAISAGLVEAEISPCPEDSIIWRKVRIKLTERGRLIANQLREHKAGGGNYSNFVPLE